MTAPPSVQTIIAHHLRALAGQDDEGEAQRKRDADIREILDRGHIKPAKLAQMITDASPIDPETGKPRGLSRQRVDQIVKGRR